MKGTNAKDHPELHIVWGAKAIGRVINRNERVAFGLLEEGAIPGARKVGGRWCVPLNKLHDLFGLTGEDA